MGHSLLQLSSYTTIHLGTHFDSSLARTVSEFEMLKQKMGKMKGDHSAAFHSGSDENQVVLVMCVAHYCKGLMHK